MLNDKANPASEITDLRSRIVTLESDNAALTNERDDFHMQYRMQCDTETKVLHEQLVAAQATNAKLREALKFYMVPPIGQLNDHCIAAAKLGMAALALPNDTTALDARLAQERKEIANTCDRFHERGMTPAECAAHIRSMT